MEENLSFSIRSTTPPANDSTRVAFDRAASTYDTDFEALPATRRLRSIMHKEMMRVFKPGDSILELNCGTGTDALFLAQHGIMVHATDASPAMITVVNAKRGQAGQRELINTAVLSFQDVATLRPRVFDGALSNLGGINCCDDLFSLARILADCIKPGGFLLLCILGRYSPWEIASFLARGQLKESRRRITSGNATARVHGVDVPVRYYSTREITKAFQSGFAFTGARGLNIVTPPPASAGASTRLRWILPPLQWIEDRIATLPLVNRVGDHVLMIFRKHPS